MFFTIILSYYDKYKIGFILINIFTIINNKYRRFK